MTEYGRLTYKPAGAKRTRTTWVEVNRVKPGTSIRSFWSVNKNGDRPEPNELIIVTATENITLRPATMSKKYCWLCLPGDPDLNNEVDRVQQ